jgi:ATP/ADP translocase
MAEQIPKVDVYSHRVVRKPFAISLAITCSVIFVIVMLSLYTGLLREAHWSVLAFTSCLVCSILLLFPPVEEWVYNPWQKQAQKVEQHHYD